MRKHTLYLLLAGWGLLAASCYDDKSTLQTTHIPPVEIEVPEAIASQLTVVHNARLDITGIRITKDGRENSTKGLWWPTPGTEPPRTWD